MRFRGLGNTELYCLKVIVNYAGATPALIVRNRWPLSKQPLKKRETIRKHCESLVRSGYAVRVGEAFLATDLGKKAAADGSQQNRPTRMRIAR